jgi:hypothetical protein
VELKVENQPFWELDRSAEARRALLSHYTAQQNGQVTRLVGFVIGLFTLLQLSQALGDKALNQIFRNVPGFIQFTMPWIGDVLKTLFLFFGTWIILYFILRAIFRFAFYGYLTSEVMIVTDEEAVKAVEDEAKEKVKREGKAQDQEEIKKEFKKFKDREIWALNTATLRHEYDGKKIYYVPAKWFFALPYAPKYPNREKTGIIFLLIVSFVLAFLLLLFLW